MLFWAESDNVKIRAGGAKLLQRKWPVSPGQSRKKPRARYSLGRVISQYAGQHGDGSADLSLFKAVSSAADCYPRRNSLKVHIRLLHLPPFKDNPGNTHHNARQG